MKQQLLIKNKSKMLAHQKKSSKLNKNQIKVNQLLKIKKKLKLKLQMKIRKLQKIKMNKF